jgi:diguanylate cyclase
MNYGSDTAAPPLAAGAPPMEVWLEDGLLKQALSNHRAGIMVNLLSALGFGTVAHAELGAPALVWLGLMIASTLLRIYADRALGLALRAEAALPPGQARRALQAFHAGLLTGSGLWAVASVLGLPVLPATAQFTLMVILAALAGGASGVLAPLRSVGAIYILLLLVPASITLMLIEPPYWVLGGLGLVFALVMLVGHRNNHGLLVRSLRLQHENDALLLRLSGALEDVSQSNQVLEQRVAERTEQLRQLARTDTLTQLLNRRGLVDVLEERDRPGGALAVLFLDLDRFKQVNDGLGHEAGDVVLREVARRFLDCTPEHGVLARWGGDEFVLALPVARSQPVPVAVLAERFRASL